MGIDAGQQLGHYRLIEQIGKGGMGVVWKAEDTRLHRHVALKLVPEASEQDTQAVSRHLREARAASALNHPHICSIYDIGEWERKRFIVMELLEGRSLRQQIGGKPLSVQCAVDLAIQIADALVAAHAKGIIHRDIKPANIFVVGDDTAAPRAKILDFGLAKLTSRRETESGADDVTRTALDETTPGAVMGTVSYMSPEQALGKPLDERADVFSLGVVLYEMITARRAFEGDTSAAIFDAILNRAPTAPVTLNKEIPAELERIVNKALEKDPALRYQSAAGLRSDLARLQRDTTSGAGDTPGRVIRKPASSGKWWLGALVAVAAGAVLLWLAGPWDSAAKLAPAETRRITFTAGPEFSGALSPSGDLIAYGHTEHGTMDLFVQPRVGGHKVRLTDGEGDEDMPRWARDGTRIAYLHGHASDCSIYTVSPLGGPTTKLVDTRVPYTSDFWTALMVLGPMPWSPDDESLLFSRRLDNGDVAVFEVDLATGREKQVTFPPTGVHDLSASWSFDGKWIVFIRAGPGPSDLWLHRVSDGESRPLLEDEFVNMDPTFLPGDEHVVFRSNRSGLENIWGIHVATGKLSQLTSGGPKDWYPTVSTDGMIAYTRWDHQTDLYSVDVTTGESTQLTSWTGDNFVGRFAPDGGRVAYHSTRTGNAEVYILDPDSGTDELNISEHPTATDVLPAWSPAGDEIAFVSDRDGPMNLWIANADGSGRPTRLSEQQINIPNLVWAVSLSIRWTPDGDSIGFVMPAAEGPSLWMIDRHGGTRATLVRSGVSRFDWYLDRRRIIFTAPTDEGVELRAANLETGEESLLYSGPHSEMILSPDGSSVALVSSASHFNQGLYLLELEVPVSEDGLPSPLGDLVPISGGHGRWHVHNGSWSHDGKRIVYTRDTDDGDVYLLTLEN